MPPRYAYWTILVDQKPTAFRAREREELLPTFNQLKRKNPDVAMKWFAGGRLWESPGEAQAAQRAPKPSREKRARDWRPGGEHRDPRDRFKTRSQATGQQTPGDRPWRDKPKSGPPRGDRPWSGKPQGAAPRGDRPWSGKPPQGAAPRGDRPWSGKPQGAAPRGDRPWSGKPQGAAPRGDRPWRDRPTGKAEWRDRREKKPAAVRPEAEAPPKRQEESPTKPPVPEQIVIKPKPPERG